MPEDHVHHAPLIDQQSPPRPRAVRPRHAASLIVYRGDGRRCVDADGHARREASVHAEPAGVSRRRGGSRRSRCAVRHAAVRRRPNICCARTPTSGWPMASASPPRANCTKRPGCQLGTPPQLDVLHLLARAVTPPPSPIRFNARFFAVDARHVSGTLGGDGELEGLRFYAMQEALALDLAMPTRRVLERLRLWLGDERGGTRGADPHAGDASRSRLADGVAATVLERSLQFLPSFPPRAKVGTAHDAKGDAVRQVRFDPGRKLPVGAGAARHRRVRPAPPRWHPGRS